MKSIFTLIYVYAFSIAASAQLESIEIDNRERTYLIHLPTDYDDSQDYPLVVAMHGGFGNAEQFERQSGLSDKADEQGFIVVYPEGVRSPAGITTWNAGWCCGYASDSEIDDVAFISVLLDKLEIELPIDKERIFATGMSNGGYMSYRLACELSDRIAAIAPVACAMSLESCPAERPVPIFHFHSYLDMNVRYEGGHGIGVSNHYSPPLDSVLNVWALINGCKNNRDTLTDNDNFTQLKWSDCNCKAEINIVISKDGGHSWPGGTRTLIGDPPSQFVSATEGLWQFFEEQKLSCNPSNIEDTESYLAQSIYPNPTNSTIYFTNTEYTERTISIYNNQGNNCLYTTITEQQLELHYLPAGLYHLVVLEGSNKWYEKILKL